MFQESEGKTKLWRENPARSFSATVAAKRDSPKRIGAPRVTIGVKAGWWDVGAGPTSQPSLLGRIIGSWRLLAASHLLPFSPLLPTLQNCLLVYSTLSSHPDKAFSWVVQIERAKLTDL